MQADSKHPERDRRGPSDFLHGLCQLLPTHLLSALMRGATRIRTPAIKNRQIRWFVRRFGVDLATAREPHADAYPDFNAFFTRALASGVRPLPARGEAVVSPVDGEISQVGYVHGRELLQAKGHGCPLERLLAADRSATLPFEDGGFLTVYLHPRDYHRVHMPFSGRLREMVYVPGRLLTVNPASARVVPGLFARNERVVCHFETALGPGTLVLVGALCVGGIETVWSGCVAPRGGRIVRWRYPRRGEPEIALARGEEMGRFNMGSTVIVLLPRTAVAWRGDLHAGRRVLMGEEVGRLGRPQRGPAPLPPDQDSSGV